MDAFVEYLVAAFPKDAKRTRSAVIHQQFGERIISCLKNPLCIEDRNFRHLIKRSGFQLLDLPEAGIRDALVVQVKGEKEVQSLYSYIPRVVVEKYVSLCSTCSLRKPQHTKAPLRPIIADGLFSRIQIDLIDMRHMPHNGCNWILHIVDHWSKFNFAFPLVKKKANHVVKVLHNYVFPVFGLPAIIHSDNGKEFVNKLIGDVVSTWPEEADEEKEEEDEEKEEEDEEKEEEDEEKEEEDEEKEEEDEEKEEEDEEKEEEDEEKDEEDENIAKYSGDVDKEDDFDDDGNNVVEKDLEGTYVGTVASQSECNVEERNKTTAASDLS
ncbi:hypothetical protein EMCRGX_G007339 [Ephydatia muelleri]